MLVIEGETIILRRKSNDVPVCQTANDKRVVSGRSGRYVHVHVGTSTFCFHSH